ncbi:MAG: DUF1800 domain-containing protein, partial [Sulfuricaulis sp.]
MKSVAFCLCTISCLLMAGAATAAKIPPDLRALHVLNRLTYGPAPGDVQKVRAMGVEKFIQMQL